MYGHIELNIITGTDDIKRVLDLFSDSLRSLSQGNDYRKMMAKKFSNNGIVLVASIESKICDFSVAYMNDVIDCNAFISMLAVLPAYRKNGIGKIMVDWIIENAKQQGMRRVRLQVDKDNESAIKFYKRNEFVVAEIKADSYYMELKIEEI